MQQIQRGSTERIYFEFRDNNEALIDPINPIVTIEDSSETSVVDRDSITLTDVTLSKESTGIYYWVFKPKADATVGIYSCWPSGQINGILKELDVPIQIEIIGQETVVDETYLTNIGFVKELLDIENTDNDRMLLRLIKRVSTNVETYCNRQFKAAQYTEYFSGEYQQKEIIVANPPILTLNSLYDDPDRIFGSSTAFISADFVVHSNEGIVELVYTSGSTLLPTDRATFNRGTLNIKVTYTGGYNTIPNDVDLGTAIWVAHLFKKKDEKVWRLDNRTVGDKTQNFEAQEKITMDGRRRLVAMPHEVREMLNPYRLISLRV